MLCRCRDCKKYFSAKTGTAIEQSPLPLKTWIWANEMNSLSGVSSMKLHRNLGVTQTTAWFMFLRIREGLMASMPEGSEGPVELDETFFGGLEKGKYARKKTYRGRGPADKAAVVDLKDRKAGTVAA